MAIVFTLSEFSSSKDIFLSLYRLFVRPLSRGVGNAVSRCVLKFISDQFIEGFLIIQESN